jgi:hypothetical protein
MLKIQGLGSKCVRPKNMGSLISREMNTRLGLASYHHKISKEIRRKSYDLGTVRPAMEPLASYTTSSVGATARCGLWPVEQYLSIFAYL